MKFGTYLGLVIIGTTDIMIAGMINNMTMGIFGVLLLAGAIGSLLLYGPNPED